MAILTPIAASMAGPSPAAAASVAYPVKISDNHRYLVDQNGQPFLMVGDSPQAMIGDISEADADYYFANREAAGFNAQWINLLCNGYTGCHSDGTTYDGIAPFTTPGDLATPNEAYFARVDHVLRLAANHGQLVLLDPIETGGWLGIASANGPAKAYNYGKFLGQRYKNVPNIVWMSGNDFKSWGNPSDDAVIRGVAQGIKDNDPGHLQTIELDLNGSLDDAPWAPLLGLDAAYTYLPTYDQVLTEYNRANIPVFMVEANYDGEHNATDPGSPQILRRQAYWTFLSGATGQLYGNRTTWQFADNWKSNLDIRSSAQFHYAANLLSSRQWYNLVPDQDHRLVTAGYGTYARDGSLAGNDYVTAARTPDGTLAIAYMPTPRPITVDLSKFAASVNATWYDPASGTYVSVAGAPFANTGKHEFAPPGSNADGDGDWALILETGQPPAIAAAVATSAAPTVVPPTPVPPTPQPVAVAPETAAAPPASPAPAASAKFVQTNNAVPQSPQTNVSVDYPEPQTTGNTNVVVVGWNDSTSEVASITDSAGNAYQVATPTFHGDGVSQAIYFAPSIAGGQTKVSVTFSAAVPFADVRIAEYAGLDPATPFGASASAAGNGGNASSGTVTTGVASALVVGAGITTGGFTGPGPSFIQRVITNPDADILEDAIAGDAGASVAATAPSSGSWVMQVATFH
jgi:hypothetical protein